MLTEQVCVRCGKAFQRSLYHPQIVMCAECKSVKKHDCTECPFSKKVEWDLVCSKTGKVVTDGGYCRR